MSRFGHFSDIHFNYSNYETNTLREALIEKLKGLEPLDEIFITGDIFYRGKMDEYAINDVKEFIESIASAARCNISKVFICAGNHDLTRNKARAGLLKLIIDEYSETGNLSTDEYAPIMYDKICIPFNRICSSITGIDNPEVIHRFVELDDMNVIMLNTSVFAGQTFPGQENANSKLEDTNLYICDEKFENLKSIIKERINKRKLTIFMGHHSPDCFTTDEEKRLVKYIDEINCDLYLCGHIHKPSTCVIENTDATYKITCGGPFKDQYNKPTFVIGDYNPQSKELFMELYCYENSWELFNQALSPWKHGSWRRRIERLYEGDESSKMCTNSMNQALAQVQDGNNEATNSTELREKYYKYIINQSSEIQLDGLPTNEEDIKRSHKLNQIYVPEHFLPYDEMENQNTITASFGQLASVDTGYDIINLIKDKKPIRSVVLGDPGAGKTTLIRWLAITCCSEETIGEEEIFIKSLKFFPIIIRCRDLKETTIWDNIRNTTRLAEWFPGDSTEQLVSLIKYHLDNGSALLLIDGLDEINDEGKRKAFIDQIHVFIKEYDKVNVIVTSRIKGYNIISDRNFEEFSQWIIRDLFKEDIFRLCEKWFFLVYGETASSKKQAQELAESVTSDDRLNNLAKNPLMLTTLLLVKRRVGALPNKRAGLYYEAVKVLLESWNSHVHEKIDIDEAKYQLAYVAFCMMKAGSDFSAGISKTAITGRELKKLLQAVRKEHSNLVYSNDSYSRIIDTIEKRSAIFYKAGTTQLPDGHEEPIYCFQHLLFEEYLMAYAITEDCFPGASNDFRDGSILFDDLMDPNMREVIALTAAISPRCATNLSEAVLRLLHKEGLSRIVAENLRGLLIQMIADEVSVNKETVQEALEAIFHSGMYPFDIKQLRQICTGKYVDDFINYAKQRDNERHFGNASWYSVVECLKDNTIKISCLLEKLRTSNNPIEKANTLSSISSYLWLNGSNCLNNLSSKDQEYLIATTVEGLTSEDMHIVNGAFDVLSNGVFNKLNTGISFSEYCTALVNYVNKTNQLPYLLGFDNFSVDEMVSELNNLAIPFSNTSIKTIDLNARSLNCLITAYDYKVYLLLMVICVFSCTIDNESFVLDLISEVSDPDLIAWYFPKLVIKDFKEYYKMLISCDSYMSVPDKVKQAFEQFGLSCGRIKTERKNLKVKKNTKAN